MFIKHMREEENYEIYYAEILCYALVNADVL
jgi:hypothetical protein